MNLSVRGLLFKQDDLAAVCCRKCDGDLHIHTTEPLKGGVDLQTMICADCGSLEAFKVEREVRAAPLVSTFKPLGRVHIPLVIRMRRDLGKRRARRSMTV